MQHTFDNTYLLDYNLNKLFPINTEELLSLLTYFENQCFQSIAFSNDYCHVRFFPQVAVRM